MSLEKNGEAEGKKIRTRKKIWRGRAKGARGEKVRERKGRRGRAKGASETG